MNYTNSKFGRVRRYVAYITYIVSVLIIRALTANMLLPSTLYAGNNCNVSCNSVLTPASPINLGSYDPYNYTGIVQPFNLAIRCSGTTPPAACSVTRAMSYTYTFVGNASATNPRTLNQGTRRVSYNLCSSANCSAIYNNQLFISNSYSFVPNVGRTDSYTVYIVVPVQPLSTAGAYTGNVTTSLVY